MSNKNLWVYAQAEKILKQNKDTDTIVFESGFGPSGYPHIGTFGEIGRPQFVIRALKDISDKKTKYIVFTDDMDGLRKVPIGMPEVLNEHLGKPVSRIPDPWGCCSSFSEHMISRIKNFLEAQNLTYDVFKYSHEAYESGDFNEALKKLLQNVEKVNSIILPTMREESRKGWSPFMPLCAKCGRNLTTTVTGYHSDRDALTYSCDKEGDQFSGCGHEAETSILNGCVKVGWKIDWAVRWYTYGVHFEMYGKDLMESASLSGKIVRTVLGGKPPLGYFYEMFLDESGAKISKSVGKGLNVERWVTMAPRESLTLFMFKTPQKAKKLSETLIPRYVDEYLDLMAQYYQGSADSRLEDGKYRHPYNFVTPDLTEKTPYAYSVTFSLLTNLIAAVGKFDVDIIKKYVHMYQTPDADADLYLAKLIEAAGVFVKEVMMAERISYEPTDPERAGVEKFILFLREGGHDEETIQTEVFTIAKSLELDPRLFFSVFYKLISGQSSGPRLGNFIHLLGETEMADRLALALG